MPKPPPPPDKVIKRPRPSDAKTVKYDLRFIAVPDDEVIFRGKHVRFTVGLRILGSPPDAAHNNIKISLGSSRIPDFSIKNLRKGDNWFAKTITAPDKSGSYSLVVEFWVQEKNILGIYGKWGVGAKLGKEFRVFGK